MTYNSFTHGVVINDPTVLFWLENHKRQKISEEFGDFTQGDTKERLTYLVHNTFGLPFSKLDAYIEAHDPVLAVKIGNRVGRFSVKRGLIDGDQEFVVATVSTNYNAFGLKGMILVGRDGSVYEVCSSDLNLKKKGDKVRVPVEYGEPAFYTRQWENPELKNKVTPDKVAKAFGE